MGIFVVGGTIVPRMVIGTSSHTFPGISFPDDYIAPQLRSAGVEELFIEPYDLSLRDFRSLAAKVKAFNPDLMILSGFQENLVAIFRSMHQLQLIKDGNTLTSYDMLDAAPLLAPAQTEGVRVTVPRYLVEDRDDRYAAWQKRFRSRFGRDPLYTHAYAYDMATILFEAAKRLGGDVSSERVIAVLHAIDLDGITGRLSFDSDGDLETPVALGVFRNGALVPQ